MKYNEKRNNASARHPETAPSIINFAYGSNLDIHQVETRCPGAVLLGKATLNGYELAFDTAGYLTITKREGSHVQGALWALDSSHVASLDRYEGIASGCYRKETVTVGREGDAVPATLEAMVYISERTPLRRYTEKYDYIDRVVEAGRVMQLDEATLAQMSDMRADSLDRLRAQEESAAYGAAKIDLPAAREYADFVCGEGHQIADCTCRYTGYYARRFPRGLQQHGRILRSKRYQVMEASEATFCGSHRIYLAIKIPGEFGYKIDVPEGFRAVRSSDPALQADLSYSLTLDEFEKQRKALLRTLLGWCNSLPEFDVHNFNRPSVPVFSAREHSADTREYAETPYFAYGFDISHDRIAKKLEGGHHVYATKAKLYGYTLACDAKGRPTIMRMEGSFVEGVLWHGLTRGEVQTLDKANGVQYGTYAKAGVTVKIEGEPAAREKNAFVYISRRTPLSTVTKDIEAFGAMRDEAIALKMERTTVARIDAILRASGCPCVQPEAPAAEIAALGIRELTPEQTMKCMLFVCPKCFKPLGECECGKRPDHLVAIDHELQPHVRMLNDKGYETQTCCAGHADEGCHGYLRFRRRFRALEEVYGGQLPNESLMEAPQRIGSTRHAALNLPGTPESYVVYLDNRGYDIRFEPRRGVKREQFVQDKPTMLSALLQWCESLPQRE